MSNDIEIKVNAGGVVSVATVVRGSREQVEAMRFLERISPAIERFNRAVQSIGGNEGIAVR